MFESLTLKNLPQRQCGILREVTNTRPAIWVVEEVGKKAIVKDFSVNGFFFRNIVGRFIIGRERRAYKRLEGLAGIPQCYGVIDGLAIVIEKIDGKNVLEYDRGERLQDGFFDRLEEIVESFHQRGIAHCDLKRAPNVIVGTDGKPYIVDWSSYFIRRRIFPLNLLYRRLIEDDNKAIIKLKLRHMKDEVTPDELEYYEKKGIFEKTFRGIRDRLRKLLQKVA